MPELLPKVNLRQRAAHFKNRSVYLLPNFFTTAALFAGFYAVINAMGGNFKMAAMAIFIAMVFDGLDGRIARLTHTQSPFGAQYDSLSDMVSFGVAPSLVMYEWALKGTGKLGWAAAFVFCAAAALRLARFNTNLNVISKKYFQGLPSPAAAAIVSAVVWVMTNHGINPLATAAHLTAIWILTVCVGLLMISNVPYYSGKEINFRKSVSTGTLMILAIAIVFIAVLARNMAEILLIIFGTYAISGPIIGLYRIIKGKHSSLTKEKVGIAQQGEKSEE